MKRLTMLFAAFVVVVFLASIPASPQMVKSKPSSGSTPVKSAAAANKAECQRLKRRVHEERRRLQAQQRRELEVCRRPHPTGGACRDLEERQRKGMKELRKIQKAQLKNCKEELKELEAEEKAEKNREKKEPKPSKKQGH